MAALRGNKKKVIEAMGVRSLNRLEIATLLHSGGTQFSEWMRPSKRCFGNACALTDELQAMGLIEPAGDSEKPWRRKYRLVAN